MEMAYFLTTGLPPPQIRTDEKKRLAVQSRNLCLSKGSYITKAVMASSDAEYARMRRKRFYAKLIVVL